MKQNLYHLSPEDVDVLRVKRRHPSIMADDEPTTPRLCVCPSVAQCFAARLFDIGELGVFTIYGNGVTPRGVWDSCVTDERWILPGQKLCRVGTISRSIVDDIQSDIHLWHFRTKNKSNLKVRVATWWRAAVALQPTEWHDRRSYRIATRVCDEFGIDPLEIFAI